MGLTPLDIHNQEFSRSFRGYDVDEVDEFLEVVANDIEELTKENERLKSELAEYKRKEEDMKKELEMAQSSAEEKIKVAQREADLIIKEAKLKAEKLVEEAYKEAQRAKEDLEGIKRLRVRFFLEFKTLLESYLRLVEEDNKGVLDVGSVKE